MEWLNLNRAVLESDAVAGSSVLEVGVWLRLLARCISQENGGVLADCGLWKPERWLTLVRVTQADVMEASDLWHWEGHDLHVHFYPYEKEGEIRAKREGGKKGGKAKKPAQKSLEADLPPAEKSLEAPGEDSEKSLEADLQPAEKSFQRKGKERKGKEKEEEGKEAPPEELSLGDFVEDSNGVTRRWAKGFPRSREQAVAQCAGQGVPPDFAAWAWEQAKERVNNDGDMGGAYNGQPIQRWPFYVVREWNNAAAKGRFLQSRQADLPGKKEGGGPSIGDCDSERPAPPCDWKAVACELWDEPNLDKPWGLLPASVRRDIIAAAKKGGALPKDWQEAA